MQLHLMMSFASNGYYILFSVYTFAVLTCCIYTSLLIMIDIVSAYVEQDFGRSSSLF